MPGSFIFVVGPSGAGKDSLISAARERLSPESFVFARRTITRRAGAPGEEHEACTPEEFARREAAGEFLAFMIARSRDCVTDSPRACSTSLPPDAASSPTARAT